MSLMYSTSVCLTRGRLSVPSDRIPAYKPNSNPSMEVIVNCKMLERAIGALDHLSPNLKFVAFPSGSMVNLPRSLEKLRR